MQTQLTRSRLTFCSYAHLSVHQLSDKQLLVRRAKNRQMGGVVGMLMILMLAMTFVLEVYLVAACTFPVILAFDEYIKARKTISRELRKRNIR